MITEHTIKTPIPSPTPSQTLLRFKLENIDRTRLVAVYLTDYLLFIASRAKLHAICKQQTTINNLIKNMYGP